MFKNGSGPHRRLSCNDCGRFQKFVGKREAGNYSSTDDSDHKVTNDELNFKLDLIIAYLGI